MGLRSRLLLWGGLCSLLLLLPLAQPPVESVDAVEGPHRHIVKAGETLSAIALAYGVAIDELVGLNKIADPNRIAEGAALQLPAGAGATGQREYIVRPGDSLTTIAAQAGVSIAAMLETNDLPDPHRLRVGQKLIIPAGGSSSGNASAGRAVSARGAQAVLDQLLKTQAPKGTRVGVMAINLATGERAENRASESFPSASVDKLAVLVEVQRQLETGTLKLTDAIRNDMRTMIVLSDNQAANRLIDLAGPANINGTMARLGLRSTVLHNQFEGGPLPGFSGQLNQSSPADMASLMSRIATEQLISPASSRAMRDLLLASRDATKLRRLLPAEARVASKSGWYQGVANDAGIIYAPNGRFVISVFTNGSSDPETANQFIAQVAQALYRVWMQAGA